MIKTLDVIGVKHQTDKSSLNHHYLDFYEILFRGIDERNPRLLEVGIQFGASIRTWREYLPDAFIFGIDSVDNGVKFPNDSWINLIYGDAYTDETLRKVSYLWFDIIIDDGSHAVNDQCFVLSHYAHILASTGILIIEDVHGMEVIPDLVKAVPEGFNHAVVDLRSVEVNTSDSILFLVWRK